MAGRARLGAGLAVAIATWALAVITIGAAGWSEFPWAWIAGVLTVMAADAVRPSERSPRYLPWLVWSVPLAVAGEALRRYGMPEGFLEGLFDILGWLAAAISWRLARETPHRMHRTLQRLEDREVLGGHPDVARQLSRDLDRAANSWGVAGGGCIVVVMLLVLVLQPGLVEWLGHPSLKRVSFLAEGSLPILLAAFVGGAWAGRMAANGRVGVLVRRQRLRLRVIPGHPDGAGGLRPLGALFLYQSLVAAVPVICLATLLVILAVEGQAGSYLAKSFWSLAGVSIVVQVLAFAAPLRSIHGIMRAEKEHELWRESDSLSRQIEDIRGRLRGADVSDRGDQESRLTAIIGRFEALEATPTWPIDASIRRRFTLRNLALLLPFIGSVDVGDMSLWERLSNLFAGR